MNDFTNMIASRLLSGLVRVCEDMTVPAGAPPAHDAVQTAASVVQAGLPAPGEMLPLLAVALAFIAAVAMVLVRTQVKKGERHSGIRLGVGDPQSA